jgi:ankyrin repeat protein
VYTGTDMEPEGVPYEGDLNAGPSIGSDTYKQLVAAAQEGMICDGVPGDAAAKLSSVLAENGYVYRPMMAKRNLSTAEIISTHPVNEPSIVEFVVESLTRRSLFWKIGAAVKGVHSVNGLHREYGLDVVRWLVKNGATLSDTSRETRAHPSMLVRAVWGLDVELVTIFAETGYFRSGINNSTPPWDGIYIKEGEEIRGNMTPLECAVRPNLTFGSDENTIEIIKILIKNGASVAPSLLFTATLSNSEFTAPIVRTLLEMKNADPNWTDPVTGTTALYNACSHERTEIKNDTIHMLLQANADPNALTRSEPASTPFTVACEAGNDNTMRTMIKNGANVNEGRTDFAPLFIACAGISRDWYTNIDMLLSADADPNALTRSEPVSTPLIAAIGGRGNDIVRVLVERGANVDDGRTGITPLCLASDNNYYIIAEILLSAKADPNLAVDDNSPLLLACRKGHTRTVGVLINGGATVDGTIIAAACESGQADIIPLCAHYLKTTNDDNGELFCIAKTAAVVNALVKAGLKPTRVNTLYAAVCGVYNYDEGATWDYNYNYDPEATWYSSNVTDEEIAVVRALHAAGGVVYDKADGWVLYAACCRGSDDLIETLLELWPDLINGFDHDSLSLITAAAYYKDFGRISLLVKHGYILTDREFVDVCSEEVEEAYDERDESVCSKTELLRELISGNAGYANAVSDGITPLMVMTGYQHAQKEDDTIAKLLLEAGADIDAVWPDGETIIYKACLHGSIQLILTLLNNRPKVDEKNLISAFISRGSLRDDVKALIAELVLTYGDIYVNRMIYSARGGVSIGTPPLGAACKCLVELADEGLVMTSGHRRTASGSSGAYGVIELLLQNGAAVIGASGWFGKLCGVEPSWAVKNAIEELVDRGYPVNGEEADSPGPLITAALGGHLATVEQLIDLKANPNVSVDGRAPLSILCGTAADSSAPQHANLRAIVKLIRNGAEINGVKDGDVPLVEAARAANSSVVHRLVVDEEFSDKIDINKVDRDNNSALDVSTNLDIIMFLRESSLCRIATNNGQHALGNLIGRHSESEGKRLMLHMSHLAEHGGAYGLRNIPGIDDSMLKWVNTNTNQNPIKKLVLASLSTARRAKDLSPWSKAAARTVLMIGKRQNNMGRRNDNAWINNGVPMLPGLVWHHLLTMIPHTMLGRMNPNMLAIETPPVPEGGRISYSDFTIIEDENRELKAKLAQTIAKLTQFVDVHRNASEFTTLEESSDDEFDKGMAD